MSTQLQQNTARSLWDKLNFAHQFEITVDGPPQEPIDRLMRLTHPTTNFWNPSTREVVVERPYADLYTFKIYESPYGHNTGYVSAKISGTILWDYQAKKTIIQGKVVTGIGFAIIIFLFVLWFIGFVYLLQHLGVGMQFLTLVVIIAVAGLYMLQVRSSYRRLQALIYKALQ